MQRDLMSELVAWKQKDGRKPLIIEGARQVGKTWLMREFGKAHFGQTVYLNFDEDSRLADVFSSSIDPQTIVTRLEALIGRSIDPANSLLIFDEIQEVPRALTSLKYFNEDAPHYAIVAAGSLMGIALHHGTSYPVGKVSHLRLYPMSFLEFLRAVGKDNLVGIIGSLDFDLLRIMHPSILELLAQYLVLGGMPKVVDTFVKTGDWEQVRQLQREIINAYDQDMSKHAPLQQVPRLREVWRSVPLQLAEENQKFTYGHIKSGARGRDYEYALLWLGDCGLVHKLNRLSKVEVPLKAYEDFTAFKVFLCDVGLLSRINDVPSSAILNRQVFGEFRGSLTEQFVLQEMLAATNYHPGYWSNVNSRTEIDFIVQDVVDGVFQAILIEVKSGVRLQSRSLSAFMDRHHSRNAVRFSQADHKISVVDYDDCTAGRILDLPLYCVSALGKALQAAR